MHLGNPVASRALSVAVDGLGDGLGVILDPDQWSLKAFPASENDECDTYPVSASL